MHGLTCDLCGETLLIDSEVRYRVKIEVFAAYDPLELAPGDLRRDIEGEMAALLERMETMDPKALEDQVYRRFDFDLCPGCQRRYLQDPLAARARPQAEGGAREGRER
jgi:hypothetical protein